LFYTYNNIKKEQNIFENKYFDKFKQIVRYLILLQKLNIS